MNEEILSFYSGNKDWLFSLTQLNSPFIRALAQAIIETAEEENQAEHEEI